MLNAIFTGRTDCGVSGLPSPDGTIKLFPDISIEGRTFEHVEFSGSKYALRFRTGKTCGCSWAFDLLLSSKTVGTVGTGVALLLMSSRKVCLNDSRSFLLAFGLVFNQCCNASSCSFLVFKA